MTYEKFLERLNEMQENFHHASYSTVFGKSIRRYKNIQNGKTLMSIPEFLAWCDCTGISPLEFFKSEKSCLTIKERRLLKMINALSPSSLFWVKELMRYILSLEQKNV